MTPEQKVVSLETAKKLKEAGFPQETEKVWVNVWMNRPHPQPDQFEENQMDDAWSQMDWRLIDSKDDQIGDDYFRTWKGMYKNTLVELAAPDSQEIELVGRYYHPETGKPVYCVQVQGLAKDTEIPTWWIEEIAPVYTTVFDPHLDEEGNSTLMPECEQKAQIWLWLKEKGLI